MDRYILEGREDVKNIIDPKLLGMGVGVFAAGFAKDQVADALSQVRNNTLREFALEVTGVGLAVVGTMLMGNRDLKNIGLAVGAVGISSVASGLYRRVTGRAAAIPAGPGAPAPGGLPDNWLDWPRDVPLPDGSYLAGYQHNGRGAFLLA